MRMWEISAYRFPEKETEGKSSAQMHTAGKQQTSVFVCVCVRAFKCVHT